MTLILYKCRRTIHGRTIVTYFPVKGAPQQPLPPPRPPPLPPGAAGPLMDSALAAAGQQLGGYRGGRGGTRPPAGAQQRFPTGGFPLGMPPGMGPMPLMGAVGMGMHGMGMGPGMGMPGMPALGGMGMPPLGMMPDFINSNSGRL
jgi:hypothetical protein